MEPLITPGTAAKLLSIFEQIGHHTYIYTPEKYSPKEALVLLFTWNAAAAKHIAKYTVTYQKLFSKARILLIRCFTSDMFASPATYRKRFLPALEVVREYVKGPEGAGMLVHSFSNGGGNQITEFAKAYKHTFGEKLPMRAQILDSSPSKGGWSRSHRAISISLPKTWFFRLFGSILVHVLLCSVFVVDKLMRREKKMHIMCRELNDPATFASEAPRVYLYSKADVMVGWEEVEEHAAEAKSKGYPVELIRFERSPHTGHIREDETKYWDAVVGAWERGSSTSSAHS